MDVLKVFSNTAADYEGLPVLPQRGFQARGPKGPWFIYIKYLQAVGFTELIPSLEVLGQPLTTECRRILPEVSQSSYSDDYIQRSTMYADFYLKPGAEFFYITKSDVTTAMRDSYGLSVIKSSRPCAKFGEQSLGKGCVGEKINTTFKFINNDVTMPERIEFSKEIGHGKIASFSLP